MPGLQVLLQEETCGQERAFNLARTSAARGTGLNKEKLEVARIYRGQGGWQ